MNQYFTPVELQGEGADLASRLRSQPTLAEHSILNRVWRWPELHLIGRGDAQQLKPERQGPRHDLA